MKVSDIQKLYEKDLLSDKGKDFFIYLLKVKPNMEDDIEEWEIK